jgi:hypothetical protein
MSKHEPRLRAFFLTSVGSYKAQNWYDNVPLEDFNTAVAQGWAKPVEEDVDCGCMLVEGRAVVVREVKHTMDYCTKHLPSALIVPKSVQKAQKKQAELVSLFSAGVKAGLIKEK